MERIELLREVTFCILMQGNGGIMAKHPTYLMEKRAMVDKINSEDFLLAMLDLLNQSILNAYIERMRI